MTDRVVPLWDLVQTAHLAARRFAEVFAEAGLTPAQYGVLASLADDDDLGQAGPGPRGPGAAACGPPGRGHGRAGARGAGRARWARPPDRIGDHVGRAGGARPGRPAAYALNEPAAIGVDAERLAALVETLAVIRARLSHGDRR